MSTPLQDALRPPPDVLARAAQPRVPFADQPDPFIVPPCKVAVPVLHDAGDWLAVNKPAGLLTVPGRHPQNRDSVWARLTDAGEAPIVLHRLDLETSGVLLLARTRTAASMLGKQFQRRTISKTYVAVVDGHLDDDAGTVALPLIQDWDRRPLQRVCHDTGKSAETRFRVLERSTRTAALATHVELQPVTGRSHQLRVHMQQLGHPMLGDSLYADRAVFERASRLMLHAQAVGFTVGGEHVAIHAPNSLDWPFPSQRRRGKDQTPPAD